MFEKIVESQKWTVDYDTEKGMYQVSYFENNQFIDGIAFDAYMQKEDTAFCEEDTL